MVSDWSSVETLASLRGQRSNISGSGQSMIDHTGFILPGVGPQTRFSKPLNWAAGDGGLQASGPRACS